MAGLWRTWVSEAELQVALAATVEAKRCLSRCRMMPLDEMTMGYLAVEVDQQERAALYRTNC
jgi:hypothetical protein